MVSGFLTEKKGYFYIVLNLKDKFGKRKLKWIPTGLTVKGNKRRADEMLAVERQNYTSIIADDEDKPKGADMLFADYMLNWLDVVRTTIRESTYSGYEANIKPVIEPYFRKLNVTLKDLQPVHIQQFYKEEQQNNKRLCGKSYSTDFLDYIYVDNVGVLMNPHYIMNTFPKLLENCGLRAIRYHDLRHTCASLLLAFGVPMKEIQEWLGHSDFKTTADIYAHLEYLSKVTAANSMVTGLNLGDLLTLPNHQSKETPAITETADAAINQKTV